jgi:antitoxin (DNA-binding transcriptional repressor) of toxin-antitoxin stability system
LRYVIFVEALAGQRVGPFLRFEEGAAVDKWGPRSYNGRHKGRSIMKFVGVRELRNKTGEILNAVRKGEKVILTKRGKPFAAMARLREEEIERLILEGRGWLKLSESAFNFWDNEEDEIWNKV